MLLHNENIYGSIPKIHCKNERRVCQQQQCSGEVAIPCIVIHDWVMCVDLKVMNFLLGQQGGCTKYLCFLCYWNSRATLDPWLEKNWPPRRNLIPGDTAMRKKGRYV